MKHAWMDIACEEVRLDLVNDAHALRIMGSGFTIIPPHEFKQLSYWYFRVWKVKKTTLQQSHMA
jgi:hypothetical protein